MQTLVEHYNQLDQFHFLRPELLWLIVPSLIILGLVWRYYGSLHNWHNKIDAKLLQHLWISKPKRQSQQIIILISLAWLLTIIALAGPTYLTKPSSVTKNVAAIVIVLDMSQDVLAKDLKPSRFIRAKFKIQDLLTAIQKEQKNYIALIVYAATAYIASPITDDIATINNLLPALTHEIIPADGRRLDKAILLAKDLIIQSGSNNGQIIALTSGFERPAQTYQIAKQTAKEGFQISVIGLGTMIGAPVPNTQRITKLDTKLLQNLANNGDGLYTPLTNNNSDIISILKNFNSGTNQSAHDKNTNTWLDAGYWLLIPILLLAMLSCRRGWISICLLMILFPYNAFAFSWIDLWQTKDQQATKLYEQQKYQEASQIFTNPLWQGVAHYRNQDFNQSANSLADINTSIATYNRGNALAKQGRLAEAISAYKHSLTLDSNNTDAKFNLALVEELLQQQTEQQQNNSNEQNQSQQGSDNQNNEQQQQDSNESAKQDVENQVNDNNQSQQQQNDTTETNETDKNNTQADNQSNQLDRNITEENSSKPQEQQQLSELEIKNAELQEELKVWLRKVTDDPSGLLRRKFMLKHLRENSQ